MTRGLSPAGRERMTGAVILALAAEDRQIRETVFADRGRAAP